jgi:hypothetical protein
MSAVNAPTRPVSGLRQLTFVKVRLVEGIGTGNVHVVQTGDLRHFVSQEVHTWAFEPCSIPYRDMQNGGIGCAMRQGEWRGAYVAMATEVLKQLDLAQSALCENLFAEYICDLLDGNTLVGSIVDSSALSCEGQRPILSNCRHMAG